MALPRVHDEFRCHGQCTSQSIDKNGNRQDGSKQVPIVQALLAGQTTFRDQAHKQEQEHLKGKDEQKSHHEDGHQRISTTQHGKTATAVRRDASLERRLFGLARRISFEVAIHRRFVFFFNDLKLLGSVAKDADGLGAKFDFVAGRFQRVVVDKTRRRRKELLASTIGHRPVLTIGIIRDSAVAVVVFCFVDNQRIFFRHLAFNVERGCSSSVCCVAP
mmetsp:Transcript_19048/g.44753  ORF Transcript_19048/g.44753 Transcript_19048/m.44753 type:complete len:218 (-) Transcript_19048:57-710(-)